MSATPFIPGTTTVQVYPRLPHALRRWGLAIVIAAGSLLPLDGRAADTPADRHITALGRLAPRDGVFRVAGPSRAGLVIGELLVEVGDWVERGQVVARLDTVPELQARQVRLQAELAAAEREFARFEALRRNGTVAEAQWEAARLRRDVAHADLHVAEVSLDQAHVKAPISGRVIEVHARDGERVDGDGILEIARVQEMFAVAEVYETDVRFVHEGQRASIVSPAIEGALAGTVDRIGLKIGKLDVLKADPAAVTDARVVEVQIRLDPEDSERTSGLTNLTVEVAIDPRSAPAVALR